MELHSIINIFLYI